MTKNVLGAAVLAAAMIAAATAETPAPMAKEPTQIHLLAQNASGETGTATLLDGAKGLIVKLRMENPTAPVQPAHIHKGTCDKLDPKPTYPLNPVKDGLSETEIPDVTIAMLEKAPFAINVHKSGPEAAIYVTCGNVVAPK
jgi:hypothetical protein